MSTNTEKRQKPLQKLISFTEHEFDLIKKELSEGWRVVSLVANGSRYVGVIEQIEQIANEDSIYIPARKKIKIIA